MSKIFHSKERKESLKLLNEILMILSKEKADNLGFLKKLLADIKKDIKKLD